MRYCCPANYVDTWIEGQAVQGELWRDAEMGAFRPLQENIEHTPISVAFILCLLQLNCTKLLINRMNSVCKHPAYIGYLCYHTQKLHTASNTVQKLCDFITFPHIFVFLCEVRKIDIVLLKLCCPILWTNLIN